MQSFKSQGEQIRKNAKNLVFQFMKDTKSCQAGKEGMKLAQIFKACGFDWGNQKKATSSSQQYWVVALVRELEKVK